MAIKKTELYSSLWASCDELRDGMDASLYKDYVLTLLFLKYVSDKFKTQTGMIDLPDGTTFDDIVALKNTPEIGDKINKILAQIAEANDLKGVIDVADSAFFKNWIYLPTGPMAMIYWAMPMNI